MTLDHYLLSMIIEALLANGMRDLKEINIVAQQYKPSIKRIFIESGLDKEPMSDSLYEQLLEMTTDYFSIVLPVSDTIKVETEHESAAEIEPRIKP